MARICHITSAHKRDDIRIFIKECITLANAGHSVSLIVADNLADEINQQVNIHSVGKPLNRYARMRKTPSAIYKKVLQLSPDFIHFHDPELILIASKLTKDGYKVIYDVHEDLPKQVLNKHWLPKFIRKPVSFMVALLERWYASRFHGIVAATPIIAARFKKYNKNTMAVCNYPLLSELNLAYSAWDKRQNTMCYIGSISQTRGIIPIINSCVESKLSLDLAGMFSGDISLSELKQLRGGEYINYLGVLNRSQIVELLQKTKIGLVTLLPTPSYIESLPIKMFEYMLAGIPVIASNFPLWQEIVAKYRCGILVDPSRPDEIAAATLELINNPAKAQQMGSNGHRAVIEHFNWENERKKLINFYKQEK